MKLTNPFKPFFKSAPVPQIESKAAIPLAPGSFLEYAFSGQSNVTATQAAAFYRSTTAVATAVDMIADAIEQIQPVIKLSNGDFQDVHPVLEFLKTPNGFDVWKSFIGTTARNYLLKHDALFSAAGNVNSPPIEVWPFSFQNASVIPAQDRYPRNYLVNQGPLTGNFIRDEVNRQIGVRFYDGPFKELFHIKGYSSRVDQIQGDSPLQSAAMEAKQIIQGKTHNLRLLQNGGRLSLLVAFQDEEPVDDDIHKDRIKKINEQYSGPNRAGGIGVISNADIASIKEFGTNNRDMDYGKLEEMASMAIYLRYQIPLSLITIKASTFNNLKVGVELLYDNAVLPTYDTILSGLGYFLMPRFGVDPRENRLTYHPESIEPLKKRKLDEVTQREKMGVETRNELRSLLPGRGPVDGGDQVYRPSNVIVVGQDDYTEDNNEI